jgi:hypothetical protein
MPLKSYGVLAGRAVERRREGATDTPHYQIRVETGDGTSFRVAVNVQSQETASELLYVVNENFEHPVTESLLGSSDGWRPLPAGPNASNLDYVRANLLDPATLRALPPDAAGPDNDLALRYARAINGLLALSPWTGPSRSRPCSIRRRRAARRHVQRLDRVHPTRGEPNTCTVTMDSDHEVSVSFPSRIGAAPPVGEVAARLGRRMARPPSRSPTA